MLMAECSLLLERLLIVRETKYNFARVGQALTDVALLPATSKVSYQLKLPD